MNKNTGLQCLVVYNLTEYLMPVLESELVSRLLGPLMCSIWNRMGVVFALLGSCNTGHAQNSKWLPLYKWWEGAIDKTDNGRSEDR